MTDNVSTHLVTIGLPVYNGQDFVTEAISSILQQRGVDLELVISDNASSDATQEICREAARGDDRVRYVRSQDNRGAAWNFNRVVHLASGHYFKWAAHDDVCGPDLVSAAVHVLEEQPSVALAYPRVIDIDDDGQELLVRPSYRYAHQPAPSARGRDILRYPSPCFEVFGVMRLDQLRRTGLIGGYSSSDRTLLYELALIGRFHEVQDVIMWHREHPERSTLANPDARNRAAWFDPTVSWDLSFPRWRLVAEHVRATSRADVAPGERLRSAAAVLGWSARQGPGLARDIAGFVRRVGHRAKHGIHSR